MSGELAALIVAATGGLVALGGWLVLRMSGARLDLARRLAGPREVEVGDLEALVGGRERAVRVVGRVRCADPLVTEDGERLVAYHRDVSVRLRRWQWRTIDRIRDTRGFELWDHAGSVAVDPARAADPLIAIPRVWQGEPAVLDPAFGPALARIRERHGEPSMARSVAHSLSVVDRLSVVAHVASDSDGRPRLVPPPGGFLISNLELDAAMRLLAGPRRRRSVLAMVTAGVGLLILAGGLLAAGLLALLAS